MPGLAGITSVKVEWVEAEKQGSAYVPKDIDPKKYVVSWWMRVSCLQAIYIMPVIRSRNVK